MHSLTHSLSSYFYTSTATTALKNPLLTLCHIQLYTTSYIKRRREAAWSWEQGKRRRRKNLAQYFSGRVVILTSSSPSLLHCLELLRIIWFFFLSSFHFSCSSSFIELVDWCTQETVGCVSVWGRLSANPALLPVIRRLTD